jgi:hypothetical protein
VTYDKALQVEPKDVLRRILVMMTEFYWLPAAWFLFAFHQHVTVDNAL